MQNAHRVFAIALFLAVACQPPADDVNEPAAVPDTTPAVRQRASAADVFDGCYYQGQRFSMGAVKIQDGVLKKCVDAEDLAQRRRVRQPDPGGSRRRGHALGACRGSYDRDRLER